jgi:hypothetical protein
MASVPSHYLFPELSTGTLFSFPADWRPPNLKNRPRARTRPRARLLRNLALEQTQHYLAIRESASRQRVVRASSSRTISCLAQRYTSDIKACLA